MTRVHTGRCCCAEKPRRGVDNKAFFFPLADSRPPPVSQHCSGLARADGWLTDPSWERALCPSHTVARQHLSHTILYKCRASPFPSHFPPPRCLLQLPLDSSFFFSFFFTPTAQNVARSSSQQDRKRLSRRVASAFLAL